MFSRIHHKLGTAGFIVAIVALVMAMAGGAYAAQQALNGKQKKEVEKIAKKVAGKPGAPGAAGAPGAKGDAGTPGAAGTNGKGVVIGNATVGECSEGGKTVEVEGSAVKNKVCNGEEGPPGSPWTAGGTLPVNSTETGSWSFSGTYSPAANANPSVSLSFPIALAGALAASQVHLINNNGKEMILNLGTEQVEEITPTKCGSALSPAGTAKVPKAASGHLCVYSAVLLNKAQGFFSSSFITNPGEECVGIFCDPAFSGPGGGASVAGALVQFEYEAPGTRSGHGTWAVTG